MDNDVLVSGVRLTVEQVAWLNENSDYQRMRGANTAAEILLAVWGALPVGTP